MHKTTKLQHHKTDLHFMKEALKEARKAEAKGEVPVGAVVVKDGKIVGRGYNRNIIDKDPSAHAEIAALRKTAEKLKNYRLNGCKIYVTIEPCPMCAGALLWARVSEIIYAAKDIKAGACGSVINIASSKKFNHRIKVTGGVLEEECRTLIQNFFREKRVRERKVRKA